MASNSFGQIFKITTWGESHGKAIGVVIDGCPSGIELCDDDINRELALRAPGRTPLVSPRKEQDHAEIYSGIFKGITTGTPISIIIMNKDIDSSKYEPIKHLLRPGHANFTYLAKVKQDFMMKLQRRIYISVRFSMKPGKSIRETSSPNS